MASDIVGKFCGEVCPYSKKGCKIVDVLKYNEKCPAHLFSEFLMKEILVNQKVKEDKQ